MKAVFSYFVVLISAFSYMVLFDKNAGGIMTVFLIVVPLVSVALTLFSRKKVSFEVSASDEIMSKNRTYSVKVHASKSTFIPLPVISFAFSVTEHFRKPEYDIYRFSMSENRDTEIKIDVFPEVCGTGGMILKDVYITDYLGIFRFSMRVPDVIRRVCIMAEIHEINEYSELLRSIYNTLPDNDDDSETTEVFGRTALPGYGYRNYVPGDSLKKINWKLSSKKNELYVRVDESTGMTLPNIILDMNFFSSDRNRRSGIYSLGRIIEASLSVLDMCVKNGIECNFSYPRSGVMFTENVVSHEDVQRIATDMMQNLTEPCDVRMDSVADSKSSDVFIVCTAGVYPEIAEAADASEANGNIVKFIVPDELYSENMVPVTELWTLMDNWSVTRIV